MPLLLLVGNRLFGVSSNFRHLCAITLSRRHAFFRYDWKRTGLWNLVFAAGIALGGWIATHVLGSPDAVVAISQATQRDLGALGITDYHGLVPRQLFSWSSLLSLPGLTFVVLGGFLVGFGSRWAGGCTSGHGITGLANLELPSLLAVLGFFAGGLLATHWLLPHCSRGVPVSPALESRLTDEQLIHEMDDEALPSVGESPASLFAYLVLGTGFGILLAKSEAVSWFRIQEMFRFQSIHMYGLMGSAVLVAALTLRLLRGGNARTLGGERVSIPPKERTPVLSRYWMGGIRFGLGWALLGACPGPIFALMGSGVTVMLVALAAALAGTCAYAVLRPRLPH